MTTPAEQVEPIDAREASKSRVVTHESLMASLAAPASVETDEPSAKEDKPDDKPKEGEQKPAKKSPQERIVELAHKRKEAEAKAEASEQRARDLEAKLQALEAKAAPMEATAKPARSQYVSDDDYVEALTDWKADQAIAKRERQQVEARQQAEFSEVVQQWSKRQETVIKAIPDYAEIMANTEVNIAGHIHAALLESERGPEIGYYLALHPEEATRLNAMKPLAAIKRIASLEADLAAEDDEPAAVPEKKAPELPKKSKAPEPISPVRGVGASNPGPASGFDEYKRRRQSEQRR